jgi:two-component system chemotaxis response regulator CheY
MAAVDMTMPILVVDDDRTMGKILRNLLTELGFTKVDTVEGGSSALAKMRATTYGLLISDWNMQPITGLMLLKEVRADPVHAKVPFILVTGEAKVENVIAAKEAGASNYIVKPFTAKTLRDKLSASLGAEFANAAA